MKTKDGLAGRADRREERRRSAAVRCGCSPGGGRAGAGRRGGRGRGQVGARAKKVGEPVRAWSEY